MMVGHPVPRLVGRLSFVNALVFPSMEVDAPSQARVARRPNVDPLAVTVDRASDRQRYFAVLDGAKQFAVNVLRCTPPGQAEDVFGVVQVRRSTFVARADPAIASVIPPAPVGEVEERLRVQRHQERVEARGGKPG
jgi:hypothetical protein